MCGFVGYVGTQSGARSALDVVLTGLAGLERRCGERPGCDAAGVAVLADGGLATAATPGRLPELRALIDRRPLPFGGIAIGHLRRAAGAPATGEDAQPQLDNAGRVAVVQDGEISNTAELRTELVERGHELVSDTGAEVVAHLLAEAFSSCWGLDEAMRQACRSLRGTFALLAVHADQPDTLVAARRGLPLAVALGAGEAFAGPDAEAFDGLAAREVLAFGAGEPEHVALLRREYDEVRCEVTDADGAVVLG